MCRDTIDTIDGNQLLEAAVLSSNKTYIHTHQPIYTCTRAEA